MGSECDDPRADSRSEDLYPVCLGIVSHPGGLFGKELDRPSPVQATGSRKEAKDSCVVPKTSEWAAAMDGAKRVGMARGYGGGAFQWTERRIGFEAGRGPGDRFCIERLDVSPSNVSVDHDGALRCSLAYSVASRFAEF